jgi:acyl-CoA synthetase (AMP-forming)/AMP-acid ligase II
MTIIEMLARNARLLPNTTALIEITPSKNLRKEITWKEFDERSSRVANALIARGIKKGATELPVHQQTDKVLCRYRRA